MIKKILWIGRGKDVNHPRYVTVKNLYRCSYSNLNLNLSLTLYLGLSQQSHFFNTYINNIPKEPHVNVTIFANITAMLHQHKHAHAVFTKLLQNYLNNISVWLKKIGKLKLTVPKVLSFSSTNQHFIPDANLTFKLNDELIISKIEYKYLDIHLDSKL